LKRRLEQTVYSTADAFITLSQAFRKLLIEEYQVKPELVHVVPAGVDLKRFVLGDRESARRRLGWPADATIVLCVRRLARRMGLEVLIEAFGRVAKAHPQALLLLGGTGALRDELSAVIDRDGLNNQVRLLGFIPEDELVSAYQAADLSIVPSQNLEGFGLTTLESLACGTPVVVTPVGGLPEAVSGLAPQLALAGRSVDALAERLQVFFRGKLSLPGPEHCRQHVEDNFGWPALGAKIKSLYWKIGTSAS
jgi:glycosyltransferase involved in cell wall biosynthesis